MLRLNIGGGDHNIEGYVNIDRKHGQEAYPLDYADNSVDEIRASHVLEHFSHRMIGAVLSEWFRVLKPGCLIKIAVPDFEWIASRYLEGDDINVQGYTMGGQVDNDDYHHTIFDKEVLTECLNAVGFRNVADWDSDADDCSSLPVSLNLQARKPLIAESPKPVLKSSLKNVSAVMSVPRLGFMDNFFCAFQALAPLGVSLRKYTGAFWGQCLQRCIEEALATDNPDYILTVDYDSLFTKEDVIKLHALLDRDPCGFDAICALQSSRSSGLPLMTINGPDGKPMQQILRETFADSVTRIDTGHFGLTMIRAELFKVLPKPWFHSIPGKNGEWDDGRTDDDVYFWRKLAEHQVRVFQANRVVIGHLELMGCWPNKDFRTIYQHPSEFNQSGKPAEAWS
jgi:hypothetical protein